MSKNTPKSQCDGVNVICPHCLASYQAEAEDFSEEERQEECFECKKTYILYDELYVRHHTRVV